MWVLLDLSAAFDGVDRPLLLSRLSSCFGICDQALDWLRSYLSSVHIHQNSRCLFRCACRPYLIEYLRDPCWVCIHCTPPITSPLGDDLSYHFHADDTQLYLSFETSLPEDLLTCKSVTDNCIKDIDLWMLENS